jgi:hypothetical protein
MRSKLGATGGHTLASNRRQGLHLVAPWLLAHPLGEDIRYKPHREGAAHRRWSGVPVMAVGEEVQRDFDGVRYIWGCVRVVS